MTLRDRLTPKPQPVKVPVWLQRLQAKDLTGQVVAR